LYDNERYLFNLKDPAFRTWQSARLLGPLNGYGASNDVSKITWIDEHAPGLSWPMSFGYQAWISVGGSIKEYGDRKPHVFGTNTDSLEIEYSNDVAVWLAILRTAATAAGKKVLINTGPELLNPAYGQSMLTQANAIRGFASESVHKPDGFASASIYRQWVTAANAITAAGGIVDLSTEWCTTGPSGYTAGRYRSGAERFRMFRLASYYQFKEPVGSRGKVYFNVGFCSNANPSANGAVAADQANWAPAYQVDIGTPVGPMAVYQSGTVGSCAYTVYSRRYTRALVLVRPQDSPLCTTYDDTTGAKVRLPYRYYKALPHNGNMTGVPFVTVATIRNAESIILVPGR
jgi:hypothetical protein